MWLYARVDDVTSKESTTTKVGWGNGAKILSSMILNKKKLEILDFSNLVLKLLQHVTFEQKFQYFFNRRFSRLAVNVVSWF
jgi:hypothetical protein